MLTLLLCFSALAQQEHLISVELLQSYTTEELTVLLADAGVPPGVVVPEYPVDVYKVLYLTPYLHIDSLVQASGAIAIPRTDCETPLASYQHGTQSKKTNVASHLNGGQYEVATFFASTGYTVAMPDYLGLGDCDPKIPIHPYVHTFSQGHTTINILRATRELQGQLEFTLNEQVYLFGYSQGGSATMAAQKIIEEQFASEFKLTATAPMSGAYDLVDAQVALILSDEEYPTPGYLPFIILAYQSIYNNLYTHPSEMFVAPYDSLMPALFFSGTQSINKINKEATPVPKHMVQESELQAFANNPDHPLRQNLRDNHLLDWAPQAPVRLLYCQGDDQVSYLNSENAHDSWIANGSPNVTKADKGPFDHNTCALFCFLDAKEYFDGFKEACVKVGIEQEALTTTNIYPNPANQVLFIDSAVPEFTLSLLNVLGQTVIKTANAQTIDISKLPTGTYFYHITTPNQTVKSGKIMVVH